MSPSTYRSCNQINKRNQLSWRPFSSMESGKWPELPLRTTPWDCDRWRGAATGQLLLHECLTNILNEAEVGLEQCCTPFNILFQHTITESTEQGPFTLAWGTVKATCSARLTFAKIVRGWRVKFKSCEIWSGFTNPAVWDSNQNSENLGTHKLSDLRRNLIRWS